ncbi:MAG: calcium-binding protein [Rhodospirillales bacterium]|nr:calcium-binding protein [Rhodospirillales bacterium]
MARVVGTTSDEDLAGSVGEEDFFVFTQYSGNDTIANFEPGTDVVDLSHFGREISWADLSASITTVTDPDDPNTVTGVVIDLTEWGGGTITLDGVTSVSDLTEASFRMPAVNVIEGTDGFDLLVVRGSGMDEMHGGAAGDILDGGGGDDVLHGGGGYDLLVGGAGDDVLHGEEGKDTLDGGTGDDVLYGGTGDDTLDGNVGADTIVGGLGNDTLWGDRCATEKSADTFVFGLNHGNDTVKDFSTTEGDKIDLTAFTASLTWAQLQEAMSAVEDDPLTPETESGTVIDLTGFGGGTITLEGVASADLTADMFVLDDFAGGDGADTIEGGTTDDTLTGGEGADTFVFASGHGNDTITDFTDGEDTIDLSTFTGITGFSDLTVAQDGNNTVITVPGGGTITLQGFTSTDLDTNDFVFHEEQQDGM